MTALLTTTHRSAYTGPERRSGISAVGRWLAAMLDEVDYGMLLVDARGVLLYLNHCARSELSVPHPLCLRDGVLAAREASDQLRLTEALGDAHRRGLRHLVSLGEGETSVVVAVVPLGSTPRAGGHVRMCPPVAASAQDRDLGCSATDATLVMLGKRRVCEALSVEAYARIRGLTCAETGVLKALSEGLRPEEIARSKGVAVSTVRTQIGKIRAKTHAPSIAAALHQVALLPPMISALRGVFQGVEHAPDKRSDRGTH